MFMQMNLHGHFKNSIQHKMLHTCNNRGKKMIEQGYKRRIGLQFSENSKVFTGILVQNIIGTKIFPTYKELSCNTKTKLEMLKLQLARSL